MHPNNFIQSYFFSSKSNLFYQLCFEWLQSDDEEDTEGYSEGNEEFSCGIELPTQDDKSSGNVTPIPTTGELEEISVEEGTSADERNPSDERRNKSAPPNIDQGSPPRTPLKSLLKKPSLDLPDEQGNNTPSHLDQSYYLI